MREYFITRGGQTLRLVPYHEERLQGRDALGVYFEVFDAGGTSQLCCVAIDAPILADVFLQNNGLGTLQIAKDAICRFAILDGLEVDASLLDGSASVTTIWVREDQLALLLKRSKWDDRDIRRYIVRRIYDEYSRSTLADSVSFDRVDFAYCGATFQDFLRNTQLLASEQYLTIAFETRDMSLSATPTAKLVRDVETFGAARGDVASEAGYAASLRLWPNIKPYEEALLAERRRYEAAATGTELLSVFRSTAPIVESLVRDLLANHGSTKSHPTLGPMLGELQAKSIAGIALISQLDHVLKFGRDLAQHGHVMPLAVLRIACENAFELVPQLAALFKQL